MAYTRLHWVESETPLSADNMNNIEDGIEELKSQKVDKVSGKALSDQNYTAAEKTKLAGIEDGAEVNVQPDWDQTNTSADDFIKNKPGNASSSSAGFMSASDKSKLDGVQAGAQVNRTYTAVTGKPTAAASPAFGGTVTVSQVSQSTTGQVSVTDRVITIPNNDATTSTHGLMSATDKTKLNGIAAGAQVNPGNATTSAAGLMSAADKTKLNALRKLAFNAPLTAIDYNDTLTVAVQESTTSQNGYMSKEDKAKLNGIEFAKITATLDSTVTIAAGKHTYITYKNDSIGNYKAIIPLRIPATDGLLLRGFRTIDAGFSVALSNITDSTKTVTSEAALLLGINY